MKPEELFFAMQEIDDEYVTEAAPQKKARLKRTIFRCVSTIAACIALVLVNVWLFTPFEKPQPADISMYEGHEHYELIEKYNIYVTPKLRYKNNFQRVADEVEEYFGVVLNLGSILNIFDGDMQYAPPSVGGSSEEGYVEVTDNQEEGVVEADIVKRYGDRFYQCYIDSTSGKLQLCTWRAGEPDFNYPELNYYVTSSFEWYSVPNGGFDGGDYSEMYLSDDGKTLTLIAYGYNKSDTQKNVTYIISIDITDFANMSIKETVTLDGGYVTSRMIDGKLIVITEDSFNKDPNFNFQSHYMPRISYNRGQAYGIMENNQLIFPNTIDYGGYSVVSVFDGESLEYENSVTLYSVNNDNVYITKESVYFSDVNTVQSEKQRKKYSVKTVTDIYRIRLTEDGCEYFGGVTVDGAVEERFYLDESDGILRVVTGLIDREFKEGIRRTKMIGESYNAALYCISIEENGGFETVAEVKCFAPENERVYSVRFSGDKAYVCTALKVTPNYFCDPVFSFDLSDLGNITYKQTVEIEGFSASLIDYGEYIVGIGSDNRGILKVELYKEGESSVEILDTYIGDRRGYFEYKLFLINRESGLVGVPSQDGYTILRINDGKLELVYNDYRFISAYELPYTRAICVEKWIYILIGKTYIRIDLGS